MIVTITSVIIVKSSSNASLETVTRRDEDVVNDDDPSRYLLEDDNVEDVSINTTEIEDLNVQVGNNPGCSTHCRARAGAGRYRCDSEQQDYNSSLLERYDVPLANEAVESHHDFADQAKQGNIHAHKDYI